ncbi:MAG: hypothetical protein HY537_15230 [Deltaproteobacteria bacterium]|nr:hypothetical protein [Deltaproteobacteria bacterium]
MQKQSAFRNGSNGRTLLQASLPRKPHISRLLRVYQDLERTLKSLKANHNSHRTLSFSAKGINIRKLITQLSRSKRRLERKIGNTILLEKQQLKRKIRVFASNLARKSG